MMADEMVISLLQHVCKEAGNCFIVIDALDEISVGQQRKQTFRLLESLLAVGVKLLVTSRPHLADIEHALKGSVQFSIESDQEDIKAYISQKLDESTDMEDLLDETVKADILDKISQRASGMYVPRANVWRTMRS